MQSLGSSDSDDSQPFNLGSNSTHVAMDLNGAQGSEPLHLLSQGMDQIIRIDLKTILENIMDSLGASSQPVFTPVDCGDAGVKFSIKLDVSNLNSVHGERIKYSVVEGEVSQNYSVAEANAVNVAIKHLEHNHLIKILDFSTRLSKEYSSYNTHVLLKDAISSLDKVLVQWELTIGNFEKFCSKLEQNQFSDNLFGPRTPASRVYGFLSGYLSDIGNSLKERSKNFRSELNQTQAVLDRYELKLTKKDELLANTVHYNEVVLSAKFLLDYVLGFYGLPHAQYSSCLKPDGVVKSCVLFELPYMTNFKFGGKIYRSGLAYSSIEAEEEAAHSALLFIEGHFKTSVVDMNYSQCKKSLNHQNKVLARLSTILELGDTLKMMFGELINAIEGQRSYFSFDASLLFEGPLSPGQTDAYHFCFNGLTEIDQYAIKCYDSCATDFDLLNKLSWKPIVLKTNMSL